MEEKQSNEQTAGEVHSWMDQFHVNMIKTIISHSAIFTSGEVSDPSA